MTAITDSNVDQLKTEHECDEHWELRRKFLLAHADKFPQDELVCLAQCFTNVEFLGCRYPKETMRIVSELSKDVVQDYRERQKGRLRRTFVGASDAASSKAKGRSKQDMASPGSSNQSTPRSYPNLSNSFKRKSDSQDFSGGYSPQPNYPSPAAARNRLLQQRPNSKRKTDVVLMEYEQDQPQSVILRTAQTYNFEIEWKYQSGRNNNVLCLLFFNGHKVAEGASITQNEAKKEASEIALREMQKIYYTIRVKPKDLTPTVGGEHLKAQDAKPSEEAIGSDNIGSKMMKLMGWTGGGLGKSAQGITEPVNVQQQMTREGIGLQPGMNIQLFKKKCQDVLRDYISNGDTSTDLVFAACFTNEERKALHQLAQQLGLKSKSYGPKDERTLTISRKITPQDLLQELLEMGGSSDKYELVEPTED